MEQQQIFAELVKQRQRAAVTSDDSYANARLPAPRSPVALCRSSQGPGDKEDRATSQHEGSCCEKAAEQVIAEGSPSEVLFYESIHKLAERVKMLQK